MSVSRPQLLHRLRQHTPYDATERGHLAATLAFVERHTDFYQRSNAAGQITASAWVVNAARDKVLLIHHRKLRRWLQPGGHLEATDTSVAAAALREVREETGLAGRVVGHGLYDVDVHPIPAYGPVAAHRHYDLRVLVEVDEGAATRLDEQEGTDLRWFAPNDLEALRPEASVWRLWEKLALR